ncbi:hypothetical protein [Planobispora rosea]|uniref:hypothetical protein n=1 Tax=Planobispora rosea TaxID=35762 RepID=UPI00083A34A3|nr:hypothetical protein [Planobispora rosea]
MISITARIAGEPTHTGHVRVDVFAGPDPAHRALVGKLLAWPEEAAEIIARLTAPEQDLVDAITPDIAAQVLHHYGDIAGRRPDTEFVGLLIATLAAAPPEELVRLAALYPGYVGAVRLATGTEGIVRILRDRAANALPTPRPERHTEGPDAPPPAFTDALATATLAATPSGEQDGSA